MAEKQEIEVPDGAKDEQIIKATKAARLVKAVQDFSKTDAYRGGKMFVKEVRLDYEMYSRLAKIGSSPGKAGVVILAGSFQKAMVAAGMLSKPHAQECMDALEGLGGDFAEAAVLGPETAGLGALLPLVSAALDSYDVGRQCFMVDGQAAPAISDGTSDFIKTGLKAPPERGPI